MTNLNSISSSLSSIDTSVDKRTNSSKANGDTSNKFPSLRSQSNASTSLLWPSAKDDGRYSATASINDRTALHHSIRHQYKHNIFDGLCFNYKAALNFVLYPLLFLTIIRQLFDFLGQIWLQILVNFFTIIILIIALFGVHQHNSSYLAFFSVWSLFNTCWNIVVICMHLKVQDFKFTEDVLSFYTGSTSYWHAHGLGCLQFDLNTSYQTPILQPDIINQTACRIDYHLIEATQAAVHAALSFIAFVFCCCVVSTIKRSDRRRKFEDDYIDSDKLYRLNNLNFDRNRINPNPYPTQNSTTLSTTASLRRNAYKSGLRNSQHSVSSKQSTRRRRRSVDEGPSNLRDSCSSRPDSHKYGSLSSRRSGHKEGKRADSLTYGDRGSIKRNRLSSLSSVDYLPSYQPPHSSNTNLLSTYGEISSIDSFNASKPRSSKDKHNDTYRNHVGSTNPTYSGSRLSISSRNTVNNYDNLSYVYGTSRGNPESIYNGSNGTYRSIKSNKRSNGSQKIYAETYRARPEMSSSDMNSYESKSRNNFQSFAVPPTQNFKNGIHNKEFQPDIEINNNTTYLNTNGVNMRAEQSASENFYNNHNPQYSEGQANGHVYSNQRGHRQPIYLNQNQNGNSETPI